MTGLEIQKKVDALLDDLKADAIASGVAKQTDVALRSDDGSVLVFNLTSSAVGVLTIPASFTNTVDNMKTAADAFEASNTEYRRNNCVENYGNLGDAKGNYYAV